MNLYRRGKVWWVEFQSDGVRHRVSTRTRDFKEAKAWMSQIDVARKMPSFDEAVAVLRMFYKQPAAGVVPVGNIWPTYLDLAKAVGKANVSEDTIRKRRNAVERLLRWISRERATVKTAEAITAPVAAGFAMRLAAEGLKSKTRINILNDLCSVWKILASASTGIGNPWSNLKPQDCDGVRGKAFTREDQERVLEAARRVGRGWYEISMTMLHTGLRYGDVCRLMWRDLDLGQVLPGERAADAGKGSEGTAGRRGGVIRLTPHKTARHGIEVVVPVIEPLRKVFDELPRTGDFLFPVHAELYGSALGRKSLRFADVLDAAGLGGAGYTIHSWRHTAATRLAEAGASLETRKRILGHTQDATAERYDHADHVDELRDALARAAG